VVLKLERLGSKARRDRTHSRLAAPPSHLQVSRPLTAVGVREPRRRREDKDGGARRQAVSFRRVHTLQSRREGYHARDTVAAIDELREKCRTWRLSAVRVLDRRGFDAYDPTDSTKPRFQRRHAPRQNRQDGGRSR